MNRYKVYALISLIVASLAFGFVLGSYYGKQHIVRDADFFVVDYDEVTINGKDYDTSLYIEVDGRTYKTGLYIG